MALATLTIGAVVATILALNAQSQARHQARVALSRALAIEATTALGGGGSEVAVSPDRAVLLALEAYREQANDGTRSAVIEALEATDRVAHYLNAGGGSVLQLAYSSDGRTIAALTENRGIQLWDAASGRALGGPFGPSGARVASIALSPDGTKLALVNSTRKVLVWSTATHRLVASTAALGGQPSSVVFGPHDELVAAGAPQAGQDLRNGPIWVWSLARRRVVARSRP